MLVVHMILQGIYMLAAVRALSFLVFFYIFWGISPPSFCLDHASIALACLILPLIMHYPSRIALHLHILYCRPYHYSGHYDGSGNNGPVCFGAVAQQR